MSFPRYPAYKDSGVAWLGEVPAHWQVTPLKHEVRLRSGGTPSKANLDYWDGEIPWASSKDIKVEALTDTEDHITQRAVDDGASELVPTGSVLIVVRGMILAHTFPVAITAVPTAINQDLKALSPSHRLAADFLAWLLRGSSRETLGRIDEAGHGTKVLRIEAWTSMPLPIPPLIEQSAITAFLNRETAKIDALVAEQRRLMDLLREKRQAVISHAVTKGLNPDALMKPSGVEWLGEIPQHWAVVKSRRLFSVRSELARPADQQLTASQKYGIILQEQFVESEGRRVVETIMGRDKLLHVEPNDFVISMRSFQGGIEWARLRGSTSFHYVILVPVKHVHPPFFARLLKCNEYVQALRTTTDLIRDGQELRYSHFVQVELPLVPLEEQAAISTFLAVESSKLDVLLDHTALSIQLLQQRRTALISAAVTGQLDVRELAPA